MRVRALLVTGVAIAATLTATADAAPAPKKACNLIVDGTGDTNNDLTVEGVKAPAGFPASGSVDLVGGDLANNGTTITAIVKLANIDPDEQAVINRRYVVQFKPANSKYPLLLAALVDPLGEAYYFGWYGPSTATATNPSYNYPGEATGKIVGNEIHISASLADMAETENVGKIPAGTKITGLQAYAFRRVLYPPSLGYRVYEADSATSKATYVAAGPSCVKVGD